MPAIPDDEVLDLLNALIHALKARMQQVLRSDPESITPMEMQALKFFGKKPGSTQVELVQESGRDKAQITRTIQQLLERGFLERAEDAQDRRSHRLSLTDAGHVVHQGIQRHRKRFSEQLFEGFSAQEREQVLRLMARMRKNVAEP